MHVTDKTTEASLFGTVKRKVFSVLGLLVPIFTPSHGFLELLWWFLLTPMCTLFLSDTFNHVVCSSESVFSQIMPPIEGLDPPSWSCWFPCVPHVHSEEFRLVSHGQMLTSLGDSSFSTDKSSPANPQLPKKMKRALWTWNLLGFFFLILSLGETFFPAHYIPVQKYWSFNIRLLHRDVFSYLYIVGFDLLKSC